MTSNSAIKVAVIGGGCASIATAFELSRPALDGRYDITIYQLGWRLGGKGASGRGPSGRIEEHGLHFWLGFYENAFQLLRECYADLAEDPGAFNVADWRKSFFPDNNIGISEQSAADQWHSWSAYFPSTPGAPGDPVAEEGPPSMRLYLHRMLGMLRTLLLTVDSRNEFGRDAPPGEPGFSASSAGKDPHRLLSTISDLVGGAFAGTQAVLAEALALLEAGIKMLPSPLSNPLSDLAAWIARQVRDRMVKGVVGTPYYQHVWEVADLVIAGVVGILRHDLLTDPRGFDAIDDYEWRDWLRLNGASEPAVQSAFVRGLYDLAFAYEDGDVHKPRLSAAAALRGVLRMFFSYRGAVYWKMRAGMGDVVFAPFYEVLRRRGVKFEFFHRLTNVRLAADADLRRGERSFVAALEFDIQARIKSDHQFEPLVLIQGCPCWPAEPDFSQLVDGEQLATSGQDFECHWDNRRVGARTLNVVEDFDFVVLGVGIGAIPYICPEILARDGRWRDMVDKVKTGPSQAFQVWLSEDLDALGWRGPNLIGSGFAGPFDTWCDMAHTVPEEGWATPPKTVVYFCGVLAGSATAPEQHEPGFQARQQDTVRRNAVEYLRYTARHLWPKAYDETGDFRWDLLVDASGDGAGKSGEARIETQYWTGNVNPSDRYVLALPGAARHRISPLDMTYDNLTIAGDWTDCGLNTGCVEAAFMSGRLAAHALSGAPRLEDIVGYDHP